jgi:hypothetical protein
LNRQGPVQRQPEADNAHDLARGETRMPTAIRIPASRKKAVLLLLGSLVFVATGWMMRGQQPVLGWIAIAFFGLGIPVSLFMMFTTRIYLLLDSHGFEMGSPIKTVRLAWDEVDGFEMARLNNVRMIAILYGAKYREQRFLRGAAQALTGLEGAIPNNYTLPLDEVFALLCDWHGKYSGFGEHVEQAGTPRAV